ncbi:MULTISPECIES: response regulator [unclassified Caballeronia]|uniref:response regulator transcription factor n=1 Tax=unclassified Caballeronia TaxID=2646786 RepID=UPI002857E08C|nr:MULTISPECIES: response regulator [unclassified Caballeronia]MDR5771140.1 response regulator [Caballeronia sp. LZ002]MDR5846577.1 response regulator [Caballeronia sp. LZ003]
MGKHIITDDRAQQRETRDTPLAVLLIEDSPLIRRSLTEAIDALGPWRVTAFAEAPDEAIALLLSHRFHAVIIDLQLRHGSGIEVLAWLQESGKASIHDEAFVAVLTNHALPTYRERCQQYGVRHFFDKSLEFDRVLDALCRHAREREGERG